MRVYLDVRHVLLGGIRKRKLWRVMDCTPCAPGNFPRELSLWMTIARVRFRTVGSMV